MGRSHKSIAIARKEPTHALYWGISVYRLWFDYAKVSPRNIPHDFGNLQEFADFEEWWKHSDYGFTLFREPENDAPVEVVKSISKRKSAKKNILYLKINLDEKTSKLKQWFQSLLKKYQHSQPFEPESKAQFHPSVPQRNIKQQALRVFLENWKMQQSGMSTRKIYDQRCKDDKRYALSGTTDNKLRAIRNEYQRAEEIFANIENGTFP